LFPLERADFANAELPHFLRHSVVILSQVRVRMRIGSGREGNALLQRESDDAVGSVGLVHRFAPTGRWGQLKQLARNVTNFKPGEGRS